MLARTLNKRVLLISLFIILTLISIRVGVLNFTYLKLFKLDKEAIEILIMSRIPRTISIIIAGSSMSIAGLIMQSISKNKFISPSTAGTTQAAILGVLMGYLLLGSQTIYMKTLFAFLFSLILTVLFMLMLKKIQFKNTIYVPLIGMMYGALISAVSTFIAHRYQALQFLNTIGVGGFANKAIGTYEILYLILPAVALAFLYSTRFSIASMGEDFAKNLGVSYQYVVTIGLFIVAVTSSLTFVMVGMLPFIGLIIPNLVSLFYGDHIKKTIFDIALLGSSFVLLNDIISRVIIYPYEISISFTMGITGSIIFLWIILRRIRHG